MKKIKDLIFEQRTPPPPEANPNDVFGKYLFDKDRRDVPNKNQEPETPEEKDFKTGLFNWIESQDPDLLSQDFPEVYKLAQKGKYSNLLAPEAKPIYRGISFNRGLLDILFKTTGLSEEDLARKPGDERLWVFENGIIHPSTHPLMSWTTEHEALKPFATTYFEYVVVFKTMPTKKNGKFLLNPNKLDAKVDMPKLYGKEREVISYGPVRYEKMIVFINPDEYEETGEKRMNSKNIINDIFANL